MMGPYIKPANQPNQSRGIVSDRSRVADVITKNNLRVCLKKFAIPDKYVDVVGDQNHFRNYYGLTPQNISKTIFRYYSELE